LSTTDRTEEDRMDNELDNLLDAMLLHVPFDGWSARALDASAAEAGIGPDLVRAVAPRGAIDLAAAYHRRGDRQMLDRLKATDLAALRFRDRVAAAVRYRIEASEREPVRRGMTLFALPQHAAEGARLIWGTADAIWTALGDTSDDFNWYTKRFTLSGVYSSTLLYWLGDNSDGAARTWDFLDRRIADVMRIETAKARARDNRLVARLIDSRWNPLARVRAPKGDGRGYPGRWH